ncbi:MAG: Gfo/Idh/MocA family oxidoreductase [SAR202 cluster bacterium]|nr:Gfo/Idh/MocA family oxidoreductase [SAR202 cluster bacterium]|tara:strand:- start:8947 stop:10095 length:1149 start_codon:yes stop_codon:yes gene_type:complete
MERKLRMGMVGGGIGSFIGPVHRIAASIDNKIELVSGAFSSTKDKSLLSGKNLFLDQDRIYGNFQEMFQKEKALSSDTRIDFVSIVTPNNSHYEIIMEALDSGFHVVCDKPITINSQQAIEVEKKVLETKKLFCLTHNYTGYPMVKEAKDMIYDNHLGNIRKIVVEYPQGWLATRIEGDTPVWRTNPKIAGISSCMGDIGTHCENLVQYITGLEIVELCSDLSSFVENRELDDDGSVLIRFNNGAKGILWASQIAVGQENGLNIRIFGEKGSIAWRQENPNVLQVDWLEKPREIRTTASNFVGESSLANTRIPAGHPEGFLEAFANIYNNFANELSDLISGKEVIGHKEYDYPKVQDGVRGMKFLEAVVKSSENRNQWVKIS